MVTGGAGFVGRNLCTELLKNGWDVTCVDNLAPLTGAIHPNYWPLFKPLNHKKFIYVEKDCRDYFTTKNEFDVVFHLAAIVGGRLMIENNPLAVAEDLSIDSMFFKYCTKNKIKRAVYFSSSAAYPIKYQEEDTYKLLSENMISFGADIGMPDMSYGWAKLTGEYLAHLAHKNYGLNVICYRPFSGYGIDQDESYPAPAICSRVLDNKHSDQIYVWGTGRQKRDFIYINDCIDFIIKSFEHYSDGSAINLSTGKLTSFLEFAKLCSLEIGLDQEIIGMTDKPEGVFARGGERTLQNKLNLFPKYTLEQGIGNIIEFKKYKSSRKILEAI